MSPKNTDPVKRLQGTDGCDRRFDGRPAGAVRGDGLSGWADGLLASNAALVNRSFGDPGALIDLKFERGAILFDIGDVSSLPTRKLLRVSDVIVSHTPMDPVAGFEHLLRVGLGRATGVRLYGPAGFIAQVWDTLAVST
jgi:hypothetical protein